ncbi:phospholipase B1, membrane-associated-like [Gigantopelta aegis]|uniref:phospholipase B1, membrane-associated-like n=1 Tax=Gigantopelta aegis TaxID=1735272 RepID=UPI001B8873B9|nr:phospholipase B1, membrane-associated-like [Gigantopelta aegis]
MNSIVVFLLGVACVAAVPEKPVSSPSYQRYVEFFTKTLPNSPTLLKIWQEHLKNYTVVVEESNRSDQKRAPHRYNIPNFQCHTSNPWNGRPAVSVHGLHPGDVKVVAAMGDSLTAGNGIDADNIIGDLVEYRGLSWSIGGDGTLDSGILTFPNILKKFGNGLFGYSLNTGARNSADSRFNFADPGDTSHDMPGQARMLVDKLKSDVNIDYHNDWKVITLFVGGNDMCDACHDKVKFSAASYGGNIQSALDILHREVPKAFVNVAQIFDIAPVAALSTGFFCSFVHALVCDCGNDKANAGWLKQLSREYQAEIDRIVGSGRYDTRDDFTVVVQPFFRNTEPPPEGGSGDIDMTYFSPDCFHFSGKGHGAAALSLWNNMLETVGHKQNEWHLNQPFHCPSSFFGHDHEFFTTSNN